MTAIFEWLSSNHGIVNAAAAVIIALFAGITTWLTRSLVKENKLLRQLGNEPKIVAYLDVDRRRLDAINFVLMNAGRGPAKNIEFTLDIEKRFYNDNRAAITNDSNRKPYGFLPQDENISMFFCTTLALREEGRLPPFRARLSWQNMDGRIYKEEYEIDVRQFLGMTTPAFPVDREISQSLKEISKHISSVKSGTLEVKLINDRKNK